MQLTTKKLVMLVLLTQLLSSCYSSKKLNRRDEPITSDFLSRLEPGKRYEFKLYTGEKQTIYVTSVEDRTITGYVAKRTKGKTAKSKYSASFKSVQDSVGQDMFTEIQSYSDDSNHCNAHDVGCHHYVRNLDKCQYGVVSASAS